MSSHPIQSPDIGNPYRCRSIRVRFVPKTADLYLFAACRFVAAIRWRRSIRTARLQIALQRNGALAGFDESLDAPQQLMKFVRVETIELYVIDLTLRGIEACQQRIAGLRHHETQAPAIGGIHELVEQSHLLQLVGHRGDESAAEMQMRCEFAHADIAFSG